MAEHEMFADRAERQLRGESSRTDVLMTEARALTAERERQQLQVLKQQEDALRLATTRLRSLKGAEAARMRTSVDERLRRWKSDLRAIARKLDALKIEAVNQKRAALTSMHERLAAMHARGESARFVAERDGLDRLDARLALADADVDRLARTHHDEEWATTKLRLDREWQSLARDTDAVESTLIVAERRHDLATRRPFLEPSWTPLLRGALAVTLSLVVLLRPGVTWAAVGGVFFAIATIDGLFQLASTLLSGRTAHDIRWWTGIANGALGIVAGGLVAFGLTVQPFALVTLLSWWAISHGALAILGSLDDEDRHLVGDRTAWLDGLAWVAFGGLVAVFPTMGPRFVNVMFGAFLYASGGLMVALAIRLRAREVTDVTLEQIA